jgi:DNA-directed RNA polymerase specialized sigma24 family protein
VESPRYLCTTVSACSPDRWRWPSRRWTSAVLVSTSLCGPPCRIVVWVTGSSVSSMRWWRCCRRGFANGQVACLAAADDVVDVEMLFMEQRRRLVNLAAAITLDRSLAEEVVQEGLAGLQRRVGEVAAPVAYLHRSVVNNAISVIRRRRTVAQYVTPVVAVAVNPEIDETWIAVTGLPARERAVVVLRFWLDWSEVDIAASLGWPAGTVKSTLRRALKRLKKEIPQ